MTDTVDRDDAPEPEMTHYEDATPDEIAAAEADQGTGIPQGDPYDDLLFVPDEYEPSHVDAEKTFAVTLVASLLFMGAVAILIL